MTKIFRPEITPGKWDCFGVEYVHVGFINDPPYKRPAYILDHLEAHENNAKAISSIPAMLKVIGDLRDYLEWLDKEEYNRAKNSLERVKYSLNQLDKEHGTEVGG